VKALPEYIADSSFLISLSKINSLQLIKLLPGPVLCPEDVYKEVVEIGLHRGYADAFIISREVFLPEPPLVKSVTVSTCLQTTGISPVDDKVLSLAFHREAVLLTDDRRMRNKALDINLKVHNSPEFLLYYLDYNSLKSALEGLVKHKRLDEKAAKIYLEAKRQWKKE